MFGPVFQFLAINYYKVTMPLSEAAVSLHPLTKQESQIEFV